MNEFIFKSYGNSKQSISYCEVDKCKAVVELEQQLDQLKAENEELKEYTKLKQTLTDIKEIAKKSMSEGQMISGGWLYQKISEVIKDEE